MEQTIGITESDQALSFTIVKYNILPCRMSDAEIKLL